MSDATASFQAFDREPYPTRGEDDRLAAGPWLRSRRWDRIFVVGGALLVPLPILLFYLCQGLGLAVPASEDIVTVFVMVLVGGPHAFATFTRTLLDPGFRRAEPGWTLAGLGMVVLVVSFAIASAFYGVTWLGFPPMHFLLTGFFFWAGLHIVQQSSFCAACYGQRAPAPPRRTRWWGAIDYLLMLGCLYPVSFFRMSMIDAASPSTANPDALATRIVTELGGSAAFADAYVFRIGRVEPILPEFARSAGWWMLVTAGVGALLALFLWKSWRERRDGTLNVPRFQLVLATTVVGLFVPVVPNLDSAFQGFNMWHSFQYLGLLWLMHRAAADRGEPQSALARSFVGPAGHRRFYAIALGVTLAMIGMVLGTAWLIESASGGRYAMFGTDPAALPLDPETGRAAYRPGGVLLAYYLLGFGFLLAHYLHDGLLLSRPRLLARARAS